MSTNYQANITARSKLAKKRKDKALTMKPKETNLDEILIQYAPELTDTEHIKLRTVLERHVQAAIEAITADMVTPDRVNPQPLEPYARGFNSGLGRAVALLTRLEKEGS